MGSSFATIVKLPTRVTSREVRGFARELKQQLRQDFPTLIVDFSNVRQMDNAGLDALLHCLGEVAQRDGTILLGEVSPEAVTVLELTRMDRLLEMFRRVSSEAEDLAASSPAQTDSQPQAVAA